MQIKCNFVFIDETSTSLLIQKPSNALPDSILTALDAIKEAEEQSKKRVKRVSVDGGAMVTREAVMDQARSACPHRIF